MNRAVANPHAVLRLFKGRPRQGAWGPLAEPVDPLETDQRARAQSILCGLKFRDGTTSCPPLTREQARDVMAWYRPQVTP